jgi:hypothetical protein
VDDNIAPMELRKPYTDQHSDQKKSGKPSHQKKIPFHELQLFRDLFLFVTFCRQKVTKNLS